jgi:hypothetical protein
VHEQDHRYALTSISQFEISAKCDLVVSAGDLVAHFNFTHKRLLWEVVSGGAKLSILSVFDEVAGFGLEMLKDGSAVLTIEFSLPPEVSWEGTTPHQPLAHHCSLRTAPHGH